MKLSLAWIFDHIDADWKKQDIDLIFKRFNAVTAEIENFNTYSVDLNNFFMGSIVEQNDSGVTLKIPELSFNVNLSNRSIGNDLLEVGLGSCFMIKRDSNGFSWASALDFGIDKASLLPAFDVAQEDLFYGWRNKFEIDDVIIEVDNKSITHRPDMWGHRGFAREIASFLGLNLKPESEFLKEISVINFEDSSEKTSSFPFVIKNNSKTLCSRFAGLYFSSIEHKPSNIFLASRLLKVGLKPYGCLIDITNYIMSDWSQPVHAYDAEKIIDQMVVVRSALNGELITLLDGTELKLTSHDLVIADSEKPMCLAGVKGGFYSGIGKETKKLFFESANFDAANVRRTAQNHKVRTDSSARYEKTLDPKQVIDAPKRFLKLLEFCGVKSTSSESIMVVGSDLKKVEIEIEHSFLESRSGLVLGQDDVLKPLYRLGFEVKLLKNNNGEVLYQVHVPSFRATKDIKIKEDILEEVVRSYGFENIPLVLPIFSQENFDISRTMRMRAIKRFFAYSSRMREQQNYAFYDEDFISLLGIEPKEPISIINPVSSKYSRLIESLIPGLFKNIKENHTGNERLAFFECGKIWTRQGLQAQESKSIAGIVFDKRGGVDFYDGKQQIIDLFKLIGLSEYEVSWRKASQTPSWYNKFQVAEVLYQCEPVGFVGKVDPVFMEKLDILHGADAFIFEIDLDFVLNVECHIKRMKKISKYQESSFDLSLLVPLSITVNQLKQEFLLVSDLIYKVELIDFFEKDEWQKDRSLTFRLWMQHQDRTLEKEDIDKAWQYAVDRAKNLGAVLRS